MSGWKKARLGDCCEITSSKRIFYSDYVESGVPFYRSKEIIESFEGVRNFSETLYITEERYNEIRSRFGVPSEGDLLLTSVGTIGVPYLVKQGDRFYFMDGNLTWFRNFEKSLDSKFLFYWLQTNQGKGELDAHTIGSSQKALTIRGLREVSIWLPDIDQQRRMISILSDYDSAIDNARRQIALLEEAAMRLYREWFGGGKWEKKPLNDVCDVLYGKPHKDIGEGRIPIYGSGGVMRYGNRAKYRDESVLIPRKGSLDNVMYVDEPFWVVDTMFYTHFKVQHMAKIAYFQLSALNMSTMNTGSAVPSMTTETLSKLKLLVPDDESRKRFDEHVGGLYMLRRNLKQHIGIVTEARDRLLPKLMSGEVSV